MPPVPSLFLPPPRHALGAAGVQPVALRPLLRPSHDLADYPHATPSQLLLELPQPELALEAMAEPLGRA